MSQTAELRNARHAPRGRTMTGTGEPAPLVALRDIWKVFESVTVLRGVNIEVLPGRVLALLGGNGSGKSTIVKILSGAYQPTAGTVEVGGVPAVLSTPAMAHAMGIYRVPQEPHIFP